MSDKKPNQFRNELNATEEQKNYIREAMAAGPETILNEYKARKEAGTPESVPTQKQTFMEYVGTKLFGLPKNDIHTSQSKLGCGYFKKDDKIYKTVVFNISRKSGGVYIGRVDFDEVEDERVRDMMNQLDTNIMMLDHLSGGNFLAASASES